jgi:hypothetical protein
MLRRWRICTGPECFWHPGGHSSFCKNRFPHFVARLEVRGREELVRFWVPNSNDVVCAHLGCDGHVAREVDVDWKWNKLVQWHQIVWSNQGHMKHKDESFLIRFVDVGGFHKKKVRRLVNKGKYFAVLGNFIHIFCDFKQRLVMQGTR